MPIQSSFYPLDGTTRKYGSTKHIATKQHMAVWLKKILDDTYVQLPFGEYDLINNYAVLDVAADDTIYSTLEVRVADTEDELIQSPADISIVAGISSEIQIVAGISSQVQVVSDNSAGIQNINNNLAEILDADVQAANAAQSAIDAQTAQTASETAQGLSEAARDASVVAQGLSETAQAGAELAEANAKASELAVDTNIMSNRSSFIVNSSTTINNMNLASVQKIGGTEILYTGNGTVNSILTTAQVANDNGDGTTLAIDWVSATAYVIGNIVYDNSTTGDARAYECIVNTSGIVSPVLDTTNWKLANNQFGCKLSIKARTGATSHSITDSIRRELNFISSDSTAIESNFSGEVTEINTFSILVGVSTRVNANLVDYVLTVEQTTRKTAGYRTDAGVIQNSKLNTGTDLLEKDSAGNPQIRHYNPVQGNEIVLDTGNGLAGRHITTGVKYDFAERKALTGVAQNWATYNSYDGATKYQNLNTTIASTDDILVWNDTEPTENTLTFGTGGIVNTNAVQYITYGYAETANRKLVSYQGVAGDVKVLTGMDMTILGSSVILKDENVGSWVCISNVRGGTTAVFLNLASVENTTTFNVSFETDGFTIHGGSNGDINELNALHIGIASTPYYAQPTGGKELTFNSGISVVGADGKVDNALRTANLTTVASALLDVGTGNANTKQYLFVDAKTGVQSASEFPINSGTDRAKADTWGVDVVDASGTVTHKTTARHGSPESETGFISASSEYSSTIRAYHAFDKVLGTSVNHFAFGLNKTVGEHITYMFSEPRVIKTLEYWAKDFTEYNYADAVSIYGTNDDGQTWTLIELFSGITLTQGASTGELDLANTTKYQGVRLVVDSYVLAGSATVWVAFGQIKYTFAVSDAPYINVQENKVLDSSDLQENRVMLGHVLVDGTESLHSLVEYPINEAHSNGFTAHGVVDLKANVYFITPQNDEALPDLIIPNKRYKLKYPNGWNAENCTAEAQLLINGEWHMVSWATHTTIAQSYGVKAGATTKGIIVKTALEANFNGNPSYNGGTYDVATLGTTATPCRVKLVRIGGK